MFHTTEPVRTRLVVAARTDTGPARADNEDAFLVSDLEARTSYRDDTPFEGCIESRKGVVLAVFDGMGGMYSARAAVQEAVSVFRDHLERHAQAASSLSDLPGLVVSAAQAASQCLSEGPRPDASFYGAGAAFTAAAVLGDRLHVIHAGDTRAYVARNGRLSQITCDDNILNQALREGFAVPEDFPYPDVITKALGMKETVDVTLEAIELRQGDVLLLCSDGLTNDLSEEAILTVLAAHPEPAQATRELVTRALKAGGNDNITVIVAFPEGPSLRPPRPDEMLESRTTRAVDKGDRKEGT